MAMGHRAGVMKRLVWIAILGGLFLLVYHHGREGVSRNFLLEVEWMLME